jgi:hypothetical protein
MAEAVAAFDYLRQVHPKVAVSMYESCSRRPGYPFTTDIWSSSSSSEREGARGCGDERREAA